MTSPRRGVGTRNGISLAISHGGRNTGKKSGIIAGSFSLSIGRFLSEDGIIDVNCSIKIAVI